MTSMQREEGNLFSNKKELGMRVYKKTVMKMGLE
jgi:hypothetical protein